MLENSVPTQLTFPNTINCLFSLSVAKGLFSKMPVNFDYTLLLEEGNWWKVPVGKMNCYMFLSEGIYNFQTELQLKRGY